MSLPGLPILGRVSTILAVAAILSSLTGCPKDNNVKYTLGANVSISHTTTSSGTSSTTVSYGGSGTVSFLTPAELGEATPQDATLVDLVPTAFTYSTSSVATATFTATTDTGYSSSFTTPIAECSGCYGGSAPSGYSAYPFQVASSNASAWENWMAEVASNTADNATIVINANVPTTSTTASGTYTNTSAIVDSSGTTDASVSTTYTVSPPPSTGCGHDVQVKCTDPAQ